MAEKAARLGEPLTLTLLALSVFRRQNDRERGSRNFRRATYIAPPIRLFVLLEPCLGSYLPSHVYARNSNVSIASSRL